jgi:hypothetical protein
MKYITPIKFPKFDLELPKNLIKPVVYTNPFSILRTLGVPKWDHFDLQCLEAVIKPQHSLEIHKDLNREGLPGCAHSLVFCPNGNDNCFLEIYEETPETKLLTFNSVSNFPLTYLDPTTAKLVETWNMKDGACTFDAGSYWHTVRNPTDNHIHILSFRSKTIKSFNILKKLIEHLV